MAGRIRKQREAPAEGLQPKVAGTDSLRVKEGRLPTVRYRPGEAPPKAGKYELVDHFGEKMNVDVWCREGERLPLLAVAGFDPVWFVQSEQFLAVAAAA
jgi:hypothetical protein